MKKLIAWLTKGSKVVKILKKIYKALLIADSTISAGQAVMNENNIVSDKITPEKISLAKKYVSLTIKYLGIVLSWFGVSAEERAAVENAEVQSPEDIEAEIERDLVE